MNDPVHREGSIRQGSIQSIPGTTPTLNETSSVRDYFKQSRRYQQLQLSKIWVKSDEDVEFYELVRYFLKERQSCQQEYAKHLENLNKDCTDRLKRYEERVKYRLKNVASGVFAGAANTLVGVQGAIATSALGGLIADKISGDKSATATTLLAPETFTEEIGVNTCSKAYLSLLTESLAESKSIQNVSDTYSSTISKLKEFNEKKTLLSKKYYDYGTKIQRDLSNIYEELEKTRKTYEEAEKKTQSARTKVQKSSKPDEKSKAERKYNQALQNSEEARAEYILSLQAVNKHQTSYCNDDLPAMMKKFDSDYYDFLLDHLTNVIHSETQHHSVTAAALNAAQQSVNSISRDADNVTFLHMADNETVFAEFAPIPFSGYTFDPQESILVVEHSNQNLLNKRMDESVKRLQALDEELSKKIKEIESTNHLMETYANNPNFGNAATTLDEKVRMEVEYTVKKNEKIRLASNVKQLKAMNVTPSNNVSIEQITRVPAPLPQTMKTPISNGGSTARLSTAKITKKTASVLYDYQPTSMSELHINEHDTVTVLEEEKDGWILAEKGGKSGIVPAAYLKIEENPTPIAPESSNSIFPSINRAVSAIRSPHRASKGPKYATSTTSIAENPASAVKEIHKIGQCRLQKKITEKAIALYDYQSEDADDLKFKAGDSIIIDPTTNIEADWWSGKNNLTGVSGQFPKVMVQLSADSAAETQKAVQDLVKVVYPYTARVKEELSLEVGMIIQVQKRNLDAEDAWWEGKIVEGNKVGSSGQFPASYTEKYSR